MYRVRGVDNRGFAFPVHELGRIFVDINLPEISGLKITRQIERNRMLRHILAAAVKAFVMN